MSKHTVERPRGVGVGQRADARFVVVPASGVQDDGVLSGVDGFHSRARCSLAIG